VNYKKFIATRRWAGLNATGEQNWGKIHLENERWEKSGEIQSIGFKCRGVVITKDWDTAGGGGEKKSKTPKLKSESNYLVFTQGDTVMYKNWKKIGKSGVWDMGVGGKKRDALQIVRKGKKIWDCSGACGLGEDEMGGGGWGEEVGKLLVSSRLGETPKAPKRRQWFFFVFFGLLGGPQGQPRDLRGNHSRTSGPLKKEHQEKGKKQNKKSVSDLR